LISRTGVSAKASISSISMMFPSTDST
jgi:hypothetical protein